MIKTKWAAIPAAVLFAVVLAATPAHADTLNGSRNCTGSPGTAVSTYTTNVGWVTHYHQKSGTDTWAQKSFTNSSSMTRYYRSGFTNVWFVLDGQGNLNPYGSTCQSVGPL